MKNPSVSIVMPAYNEDAIILKTLENFKIIPQLNYEILVVVDSQNDSTIQALEPNLENFKNTEIVVQDYGPGPANAIRFGMDKSRADCVIVMMADGSDDVKVIPDLVNLVERGVAIACASRYMSGGQLIGGPRMKKFISKLAGRILYTFAGVGTHDPTNSFKAYSKRFLSNVKVESRSGFEVGIELISKARRFRLPIAEVPTIWLDRTSGVSNFRLTKWLPKYLRWFFHCFGPSKVYLTEGKESR